MTLPSIRYLNYLLAIQTTVKENGHTFHRYTPSMKNKASNSKYTYRDPDWETNGMTEHGREKRKGRKKF